MDPALKNPAITVFMPAYNAERHIGAAIESILRQSFRDFELLIINDGSTDGTAAVISSFNDPRIRLINNPVNSGLVAVRNQGMREARGKYIALLDADDIALPDRLAIEKQFLDNHAAFALVGSSVALIDADGKHTGVVWKNYFTPEELPVALLFGNRIAQSSVMLRREMLPENPYREGFAPTEDYDLWLRLSDKHSLAVLPDIITLYRAHPGGQTTLARDKQQKTVEVILRERLAAVGLSPSPEELFLHRKHIPRQPADVMKFLSDKAAWLKRVREILDRTGRYDKTAAARAVDKIWYESCGANAGRGMAVWRTFRRSGLHSAGSVSLWRQAKLFLRCLARH